LAFVFAATWFISTAMATHLPRMLEAAGATVAAAVAVGALIGPAQVAGRVLEFGFLRRVHPLLSARLAALAHPAAVAVLLMAGPAMAPVFAVLHGAGNGILTIAKGTLPLVLFGSQGYGARQGWLMMPARIAQAAVPLLFGLALDAWGANALWLSGAIGLAACGALMLLRAQPGGH
ncbi:MAG: MFS transporter, partial [Achromobacter sp.]